jgi:putative inner membrane exporter YdcZ
VPLVDGLDVVGRGRRLTGAERRGKEDPGPHASAVVRRQELRQASRKARAALRAASTSSSNAYTFRRVLYVGAALLLLPRIGAGTTIGLFVAGQMAAALMLDHFGVSREPSPVSTPDRSE